MRCLKYCAVFLLAVLSRAQAQQDDRAAFNPNFRDLDAEEQAIANNPQNPNNPQAVGQPIRNDRAQQVDPNGIIDIGGFGPSLDMNSRNRPAAANGNQGFTPGQTGSQPNSQFVIATPEGPGLHAGFQAVGSNYATSLLAGLKSPDGENLETTLNLAGRLGTDSNSGLISPMQQQQPIRTAATTQQPIRNGQQQMRPVQQFPLQNQAQNQVPTRFSNVPQNQQVAAGPLQDEGASFAVSYRPGLLSAIGNLLNPFRMMQQFGDAVAGMTGMGQQGMFPQQGQYVPPQAQRSRGPQVQWVPLYQALTPRF